MGRGKVENLRKFSEMSVEERDAIQAKGRAANKKRIEEDKLIEKILLRLLALPSEKVLGEQVLDEEGKPANTAYATCLSAIRKQFETGDMAALEKLMKAIGQNPADKVESKVQAQIVYGWED